MEQNVIIRTAKSSDAQEILGIYAPYVEQTAISFEYDVPSIEEFTGRIEKTLEKYPYIVAEISGKIVGYAYAGKFKDRRAYDWAVETSIYVSGKMKRVGIGRLLYLKLEEVLRKQGILNLNACITVPKTEDERLTFDSVRFHEKLGYTKVGEFHDCGYKFGRWYNMMWMEKHIGEHVNTGNQAEVKAFPEIKALD